ncbi:MAG: hypothetical protein Ct9H300mP16_09290 [Pseudomonadota bacterium]|nr:MAG: hypothetical protein Ct9H300mP16_09290 [Pseudomonadota bacterium]
MRKWRNTLDLMHTELADGLERRLDVIDFATPVSLSMHSEWMTVPGLLLWLTESTTM